jgi:hypothetical protein
MAHRLLERPRWLDAQPSSPALSGDRDKRRPVIDETTRADAVQAVGGQPFGIASR